MEKNEGIPDKMVIPSSEIKQSKNAPFDSRVYCLRRNGQWGYVHNFGFYRGCENNLYLKIAKLLEEIKTRIRCIYDI